MRPDSSGLAIFTCLSALIKRVKLLTEERTLKSKATPAKVKKLAKVQFAIDSCRLRQPIKLFKQF